VPSSGNRRRKPPPGRRSSPADRLAEGPLGRDSAAGCRAVCVRCGEGASRRHAQGLVLVRWVNASDVDPYLADLRDLGEGLLLTSA